MTGLGSSPVCLGWGFGCAEPGPHPVEPCCGSQGCSCCHSWLSPKRQWVGRYPRTSALGGVGSCSHAGAMGRDAHSEIPSPPMQSFQGHVRDFGGEVEPEDTWTRAAGGACGVLREGRNTAPGILGCPRTGRGAAFAVGGAGSGVRWLRWLRSRRRARSSAQRVCGSPSSASLHPNPASPALPVPPGSRRVPLHLRCHRLRCASRSHGVPRPPGCLRAPQVPGPCPAGPLRSPENLRAAAAVPGEFASSLPFSRRCSGGARAGGAGRHRAGQGASLHRYRGRPEPGPCSSWPVSHRCPGPPSCPGPAPGAGPRSSNAGGGRTVGSGGGGSSSGAMGAAPHVSEQGFPPGE